MDIQNIAASAAENDDLNPKIHAERVLQADADFFCYYCAWTDESIQENFNALKNMLQKKRVMAGAGHINVHLTLGLKGGREQFASVKPYQENRADRDPIKTERVRQLRTMLGNYKTPEITPVVNVFQEADDSLSQMQLARRKELGNNSSIIMSGDKDLWMVEGLHCDPETGRVYNVKGYGSTSYKEVGNVKPKLIGTGTSWFWHQMIMGDTADNIPGLPKLTGRLANKYLPTKTYNPNRKALACGEAKAVAMLNGVTNDYDAMKIVTEAYSDFYRDGWQYMFLEQAFLLWMRRTSKVLDVCDFLKEVGFNVTPSGEQKDRLKRFKQLAKLQMERFE